MKYLLMVVAMLAFACEQGSDPADVIYIEADAEVENGSSLGDEPDANPSVERDVVPIDDAPDEPDAESVECGNGVIEGDEECDHGDSRGTGCSADCRREYEAGKTYSCTLNPSTENPYLCSETPGTQCLESDDGCPCHGDRPNEAVPGNGCSPDSCSYRCTRPDGSGQIILYGEWRRDQVEIWQTICERERGEWTPCEGVTPPVPEERPEPPAGRDRRGGGELPDDGAHGIVRLGNNAFMIEADLVDLSIGGTLVCGIKRDGEAVCIDWAGARSPTALEGEFQSISVGESHYCGLRRDGSVDCAGDGRRGENVDPVGQFTTVASGATHNCGIRNNGTVHCWGNNWLSRPHQEVGQATPPEHLTVEGENPAVVITAGAAHSCAVKADGRIECWGSNLTLSADDQRHWGGECTEHDDCQGPGRYCSRERGQCFSLHGNRSEVGQANAPEGRFESVAAGSENTCAIHEDGHIVCWGRNNGIRDPQEIPQGNDFAFITLEGRNTCAIRTNGELSCWAYSAGSNRILEGIPVTKVIGSSTGLSAALTADGNAYFWTTSPRGSTLLRLQDSLEFRNNPFAMNEE